MYKHRYDAENRIDSCPYLANAIRKYGWDNMRKEAVFSCPDELLNFMECLMIQVTGSLYPGGYNMTPGGDGNGSRHSEEFKRNKSEQMRINGKDEKLRPYIHRIATLHGSPGYCVEKPGHKYAQYCSPELSMEEKLRRANEYLDKIENGIVDDTNRYKQVDTGLNPPKYIHYIKEFDGWRVNKPGFRKKEFKARSQTREVKFQLALEHLNSLK